MRVPRTLAPKGPLSKRLGSLAPAIHLHGPLVCAYAPRDYSRLVAARCLHGPAQEGCAIRPAAGLTVERQLHGPLNHTRGLCVYIYMCIYGECIYIYIYMYIYLYEFIFT